MRITLSLFAVTVLAGCPGKAPPDQSMPDAAEPDADMTPTGLMLTGKAMDYFGNVPLDAAAIETDGLEPKVMTTSAMDGAFQVQIAVGSAFYLIASKANYRPTRNTAITVADMAITQDVYLMTTQDVTNQYTGIGATPVAGTAFVTAELRRNDNTVLENIPLTAVQLLDSANAVVTGVKGP